MKIKSLIPALAGGLMLSTVAVANTSDVAVENSQLQELIAKQEQVQRDIAMLKERFANKEALGHADCQTDCDTSHGGRHGHGLGQSSYQDIASRFSLHGHFGLEFESFDGKGGAQDASEFGYDFSMKALFSPEDNFTIGAGVRVKRESAKAHATALPDNFASSDLVLDEAYVAYSGDGWSVIGGQHASPFVGTSALLDADIRLAGISGLYQDGGAFANAGLYNVTNEVDSNRDIGRMAILQVGYECDAAVTALSYRYLNNVASNSLAPTYDGSYESVDLYTEYKSSIEEVPFVAYGQVLWNFGASDNVASSIDGRHKASDRNLSTVLGLSVDLTDKLSLSYEYSRIGADSIVDDLVDEHIFGAGSKNHRFGADYKITENSEFSMVWVDGESDTGASGQAFVAEVHYCF